MEDLKTWEMEIELQNSKGEKLKGKDGKPVKKVISKFSYRDGYPHRFWTDMKLAELVEVGKEKGHSLDKVLKGKVIVPVCATYSYGIYYPTIAKKGKDIVRDENGNVVYQKENYKKRTVLNLYCFIAPEDKDGNIALNKPLQLICIDFKTYTASSLSKKLNEALKGEHPVTYEPIRMTDLRLRYKGVSEVETAKANVKNLNFDIEVSESISDLMEFNPSLNDWITYKIANGSSIYDETAMYEFAAHNSLNDLNFRYIGDKFGGKTAMSFHEIPNIVEAFKNRPMLQEYGKDRLVLISNEGDTPDITLLERGDDAEEEQEAEVLPLPKKEFKTPPSKPKSSNNAPPAGFDNVPFPTDVPTEDDSEGSGIQAETIF